MRPGNSLARGADPIASDLLRALSQPTIDVAGAALVIARLEYPQLDPQPSLTELARYLPRHDHRNRYLRSSMRAREGEIQDARRDMPAQPFELPPGGSFEPDPNTNERNERLGTAPHDNHASS